MVFWAKPRTRRAATAAMRSRAPSPSLTASCSGRADGSGGTGLDRGPHRLGDRQILNGYAGQVHHHPFVIGEILRAADHRAELPDHGRVDQPGAHRPAGLAMIAALIARIYDYLGRCGA